MLEQLGADYGGSPALWACLAACRIASVLWWASPTGTGARSTRATHRHHRGGAARERLGDRLGRRRRSRPARVRLGAGPTAGRGDAFDETPLIRRSLTDAERAYYLVLRRSAALSPRASGRAASAGRSRSASEPPRTKPAWITTGSVTIQPGTGTSPRPRPPRTDHDPRHHGRKGGHPWDLIRLSMNEIRRPMGTFAHTVRHTTEHVLHWSRRRRLHQHQARLSHYRHQGHRTP